MYQRLFSVPQKKKEPVFLKVDSGSLISPQERLPKRTKSPSAVTVFRKAAGYSSLGRQSPSG